jgi:hypothetical protein
LIQIKESSHGIINEATSHDIPEIARGDDPEMRPGLRFVSRQTHHSAIRRERSAPELVPGNRILVAISREADVRGEDDKAPARDSSPWLGLWIFCAFDVYARQGNLREFTLVKIR